MAVHPKARQFLEGIHGPGAHDFDEFIDRNGARLIAVARGYSANAADAEDAYQRALEQYLTKAPDTGGDDEQLFRWLCVVTRNEALMIRRGEKHRVPDEFDAIAETLVAESADIEQKLIDAEHTEQGREALRRLNETQARCLLLRADGMDYPQICEHTGFSYAKVNRCLSEGRKAMRARIGMITSGAECRRLEPTLSAYADGAADAQARADVALHLKHCLACQATLREYIAAPRQLAAAIPVGAIATGHWWSDAVARPIGGLRAVLDAVQEKLFGHVAAGQQGAEIAMVKKAALVTAVAVTATAGGAGVTHVVRSQHDDNRTKTEQTVDQAPAATAPQAVPEPSAGTGSSDAKPDDEPARAATDDDVVDPTTKKTQRPEAADPQQTQAPNAAEPPVAAPEPAPAAPAGGGEASDGGFAP